MESLKQFLSISGLRIQDIVLIIGCPFGASLGSIAQAILLDINPTRMPGAGHTRLLNNIDAFGRMKWLTLRVLLGAILGLFISLYFLGSIDSGVSPVSRIIGFSILLGYAAPKIWVAQERLMLSEIDKRVEAAIDRRSEKKQPNRALEPTIFAVTPRAPSSTSRASEDRGSP